MMPLGFVSLWGVAVGLDLISVGQFMIARPLVAGTVAGAILGDLMAGALVGVTLELFALDVLPVGAVRYPDYGIGAVAGTVAAAHAPSALVVGIAAVLGLVVAYVGEIGIGIVRSRNSRDLRRLAPRLDAGDWQAVSALTRRGVLRETARALVVTGIGIALALLVKHVPLLTVRSALLLTVVIVGAGIGTAATGAMRLGGRGLGLSWFVLGLLAGAVVLVVR